MTSPTPASALERVLDVDVDVVADEQRVVLALLGIDAGGEHEPGLALLDRDAVGADVGRQPAERLVTRFCTSTAARSDVARDVEGHGDLLEAAVGARGAHVEHPLDAVDRLLERRRDAGLDCLGVRRRCRTPTTVTCGGASAGYCATGIVGIAIGAGEDQDERADRGEDRPADEGIDEHLLHFDGGVVGELLHARDHDAVAGFDAAFHDVVVADDLADLHRALACDEARPGARRRSRST